MLFPANGKSQLVYDPDTDTYRCPTGQTLPYRFGTVEKKRHIRYYKTSPCGPCALREKCARNQEGRRITRWVKVWQKVRAEFSLSTLAYNIRRVLNIVGVERLLAALRGARKARFLRFGVQTSLQRRILA